MRQMTTVQFAHKVGWEGGIVGALDYGLLPEDVDDPELARLWGELRDHYDAMTPLMAEVDIILRRARREKEDA